MAVYGVMRVVGVDKSCVLATHGAGKDKYVPCFASNRIAVHHFCVSKSSLFVSYFTNIDLFHATSKPLRKQVHLNERYFCRCQTLHIISMITLRECPSRTFKICSVDVANQVSLICSVYEIWRKITRFEIIK